MRMCNCINFLKTRKLLLLMLVGLLGLTSCYRTITCPAFDLEILSWIPYQENDVIELYSHVNDSTITLLINSVYVAHTTNYSTAYDCGECWDDITIDGSNFYLTMFLDKNVIGRQDYRICDTPFSNYSELTNFLFENQKYDIVRIYENNSSSGTFKKLIMAKDIGVVGLIDKNDNTWVLKTNNKVRGGNERKNIEIHNIGCG